MKRREILAKKKSVIFAVYFWKKIDRHEIWNLTYMRRKEFFFLIFDKHEKMWSTEEKWNEKSKIVVHDSDKKKVEGKVLSHVRKISIVSNKFITNSH